MAMAKNKIRRKYMKDYINLGLTYILSAGKEKHQCVVCSDVLSEESMKSNKLRRHLELKHPKFKRFSKKGSTFSPDIQKHKDVIKISAKFLKFVMSGKREMFRDSTKMYSYLVEKEQILTSQVYIKISISDSFTLMQFDIDTYAPKAITHN
ncbi:protein FAM200B-like [Palaemon carinicauda]|uniref:protein FAM200B-like n=1 Tax=Palaemon carinicauda TaxID=392227 RepID=UPI0035B68A8E